MSLGEVERLRARAAEDPDFQYQWDTTPLAALQGYDLTDDERRNFVLPNFSWFIAGTLAGCSRPRTADAFTLLRDQGVRALVSVTVGPLPPEMLGWFDLSAQHFSVEDAPTLEQIEQAITAINRWTEAGVPVAVHCDAGKGRTGCILACYSVSEKE